MKGCCYGTGSSAEESYRKVETPEGVILFWGQTSTQELALAKPMKQSKKFISQSLGHSVTDESSSMTVKISGGGDILGLHRRGCCDPCSDTRIEFVRLGLVYL
jgi:hypothetical protein